MLLEIPLQELRFILWHGLLTVAVMQVVQPTESNCRFGGVALIMTLLRLT